MDFLTRFGIGRSRLTILVMVGLIVQGLLVYVGMPKRENPAITIRNALVTVQFPGMAPDRMEDLILVPVERTAREIGEIEDINQYPNFHRTGGCDADGVQFPAQRTAGKRVS